MVDNSVEGTHQMFSRVHIGLIFVHRPRLVGGNFTSILGEGIAVQVACRLMLNSNEFTIRLRLVGGDRVVCRLSLVGGDVS